MKWLRRLLGRKPQNELPASLLDLRRGDPCWCGSGKAYARCHRREDRARMRALGLRSDTWRQDPFL